MAVPPVFSAATNLTPLWPLLRLHLAVGIVFLMVASVFATVMGWVGGVAWVLAWPAVSFIVVGAGYVRLGARVLGKRGDGTYHWSRALLLMPYLAATETAWYVLRVMGTEAPWHEVSRGLFLGRRVEHWELPARVSLVLDLTAEFVEPVEVRGGRRYCCLPTLDASAPAPERLAAAIAEAAACPGNVYVHCAAGYGRSAMAMAALLVARGVARDVDEAVAMMQRVRPRVRLRTAQRAAAQLAVEQLLERQRLLQSAHEPLAQRVAPHRFAVNSAPHPGTG